MTILAENSLFITGIAVHYENPSRLSAGGWKASLQWQDSKYFEPGSVQGEIKTQFCESNLSDAIESVINIAKEFKVFNNEGMNIPINLYYQGDGKDKLYPPVNGEWLSTKELLIKEAKKRNWQSY